MKEGATISAEFPLKLINNLKRTSVITPSKTGAIGKGIRHIYRTRTSSVINGDGINDEAAITEVANFDHIRRSNVWLPPGLAAKARCTDGRQLGLKPFRYPNYITF
jgi:hypothetical protein